MTDPTRSPKIKSWHLDRSAVVYVRQSTPQQVAERQESPWTMSASSSAWK